MKHLLLALCLVAPASAQDRVTVRGTWRADYDNYWTNKATFYGVQAIFKF